MFGTVWFLLLFFAAFTSSVAVAQPVMAFFQDEAKLKRSMAAVVLMLLWFFGTLPVLYFYKYGVLNELDFWAGTIGLVVFALIEVVIFNFMFGTKRGWEELHKGALMQVPGVFRFVVRWITPPALVLIFGGWFYDAISNDTLIPRPTLQYGVVDRPNYQGDFVTGVLPGWSEEDAARQQEQADTVLGNVQQAVEQARRDLRAEADVSFLADGSIRVDAVRAEKALQGALDPAALQRYLGGLGYRYETRQANGSAPTPTNATIAIEALHTAPFIWMARLLMAVFGVGFLVAIHALWKDRTKEATA